LDGGKLYLSPKGHATVKGEIDIGGPEAIEIQADATGIGSFIDNGTITYTAKGGSAKVQTYLSNSAAVNTFYIHLVGPTVDEENYTGSGSGAFLSAFNVSPGNTYAYEWDETQAVANGWKNLSSLTDEIHTGSGIALSTTDAMSYTLEMKGKLMTGDISTDALTYSNNHYELVSNPYPSAIDFDLFAGDATNSTVISNKNWLWDPSTGNYLARSGGSGGQQYIQVGQAFFVETTTAGSLTFKNTFRKHSTASFREANPNEITVKVRGGNKGYKDELVVRFIEDATFGYDQQFDAEKLYSFYDDATMISTSSEDGMELAINFLPLESLTENMVSVPLKFVCGYSADYTFDFSGMQSFTNGNEIWLEDKNETDWINLNEVSSYKFSANPDDNPDRFVLHFFGPTGINQIADNNTVDIYSWKHFAFIKNNTPEDLKTVLIYGINGGVVKEFKVLDGEKVVKINIPFGMGYYVVKAITGNSVFTNKILIQNY
jgi:hypothetical protein